MISFSKNDRAVLNLIRSVLGISTAVTVFLCGGALGWCAQEAPSGRSNVAEFQKLEPWLKFLRARSARDYAITTPNGIDEATNVEIGGIEQWITIHGEDRKNPVLLFLHGGPGDCHQSLGVRSVSQLAEVLHRRAMASAWRWKDVRTKRSRLRLDHRPRPNGTGRH